MQYVSKIQKSCIVLHSLIEKKEKSKRRFIAGGYFLTFSLGVLTAVLLYPTLVE